MRTEDVAGDTTQFKPGRTVKCADMHHARFGRRIEQEAPYRSWRPYRDSGRQTTQSPGHLLRTYRDSPIVTVL